MRKTRIGMNMPENTPVDLSERERVEMERSAQEAAAAIVSDLKLGEENIARYMDPPATTCFPLEYAFYLLGDVRGKTILDLGCGDCEISVLLARRGARVKAMDISLPTLEIGRRRLEANGMGTEVETFIGSAHNLSLPSESVDVVFGNAVLHHLELEQARSEIARILRPSGCAIFKEPIRNSQFVNWARTLIPYRPPHLSPYERALTETELDAFAKGFRHVEGRRFRLPYAAVADVVPSLRRWRNPLLRFDAQVLRVVPSLGYFATIKVVRLTK